MNIRRSLIRAVALTASLVGLGVPVALAQEQIPPPPQHWSFAGPFGLYDPQQLQRGFKIYREVCSNCHSLKLLAFRNLADPGGPGFTVAQAAAIAATFEVTDGPNDQGEMYKRPGKISDHFPPPFPNEQAARAALGGALPPDMSDLAKARSYERGFPWFIFDAFTQYQEEGPDYIHAILNGYEEAPPGFTLPPGSNYNKYFPGHAIAMPKPLNDGQVEYTDGTPQTVDQYGRDVAAFLMWASEPKLDERKRLGFQVFVFLIVLTGLLYFSKRRVWEDVKHHPELTASRPAPEYSRDRGSESIASR
jgi:cytochrome c1